MHQSRLRQVAAAVMVVATMVLAPPALAHRGAHAERPPVPSGKGVHPQRPVLPQAKGGLPFLRHSVLPGRPGRKRLARRGPVAAASHATTGIPYHELGTQYCRYGQISVNLPEQVVSKIAGNQYVWFQTDVYKWTSSGWSYVRSTPFFRAVASPNGLLSGGTFADPWAVYDGSRFVQRFPGAYDMALPSGWYMTAQSIWWDANASPHVEFPFFFVNSFTGSRYCSF